MSSKPGRVKRAPSTSKKKGGTPDSSTPSSSGAHIGVDKLGPESSIDDVLVGEDVQALRIAEEDLIKTHPPKPLSTGSPHKRKVLVRRNQLTAADTGLSPRKEKEVAVLHPLPSGAAFTASKTIGTMEGGPGPRFDQRGMFLSHSVIGPAGEYVNELGKQPMAGSTTAFVKPPLVAPPTAKQHSHSKPLSYENTILPKEKHSLQYWEESMQQRKVQQEYLSSKCETLPGELVMNQGDKYRSVQEERMIIDRALPSVGYGKGHRVGSEFWSQRVHIGTQDTGIHTTLTRTEQGLPPDLEFVGVPTIVARERGLVKDSKEMTRFHYTWEKSPYLLTRKQQLAGATVDAHIPEVSELALVGKAPGLSGEEEMKRVDSLDSLGDSVSSDSEVELGSILDVYEDVSSQPIIGPALLVNGQLLKWEGPPLPGGSESSAPSKSAATQSESALGRVQPHQSTASLRNIDRKKVNFHNTPIEFRLNFDSETGIKAVSNIELENCGTAAVYYNWQSLPKPNPLGTIQAGDAQRFYFDTRGGVLLPGQKLTFPFAFKSRRAGIFSEMWLLQTGPVLCRGRQIVFVLKGVAFQEDQSKAKIEDLERELQHRMAVDAAERLVSRLVESIRTPPHTPQPLQTIEMEEHVFKSQNPELYYQHAVVQQLKHLYDSILRPDLLSDQLTSDPSARTEKSGTSRKDDKSGAQKSKASAKDKKGNKAKDDSIKEEQALPPQEEIRPQIPDWDLSIPSLREVILGVDDVSVVEGKLKELSSLVGLLSFPPAKQVKRNPYNTVYEALCEAVDQMCSVSNSLCRVMGLPLREFSQRDESSSGDKLGEPEVVAPSQPSSPAQNKDKKRKDSNKKLKPGKDTSRASSSKTKTVPTKKSKSTLGVKESDNTVKQITSEVVIDIDPVMEKKYNSNLYSSVYEVLGTAMDRIDVLLSLN